MEAIFHEKQEGSLCAQHCLNALLQGPYFSAVDLADIARQLDETERLQMAEAGTETEGYQHFLKQPSNNYDDSGFFSVQVIDKAVRVMGLELISYNSTNPISQEARENPVKMKSYICNFGEHWLTVRKLGNQWFNLNSLLTGPELISDTFLAMFLTQLQQDGYSIFIVNGDLAECEADHLLRLCPAVQPIKPQLIHDNSQSRGNRRSSPGATGGEQDEEVDKALKESKKLVENDDVSLQRALMMSMEGYIEESVGRIETACATGSPSDVPQGQSSNTATQSTSTLNTNSPSTSVQGSGSGPGYTLAGASGGALETGTSDSSEKSAPDTVQPDVDEVRQKRLAFLNRLSETASGSGTSSDSCKPSDKCDSKDNTPSDDTVNGTDGASNANELTEEEMLQQAIAMSMSQET